MKKSIIMLIGFMLFAFISCTKKTAYSTNESSNQIATSPLDTIWHLKNRIPNCDSSLVFMKQVIEPLESHPRADKLLPRERETVIRIPGESLETLKDEKYKFYINPDCLIGKPTKVALDIFCLADSVSSFVLFDEKVQLEKSYWVLSARGFGNSLGIRFEGGFIKSAEFRKIKISK
ncbi:MAG: hypothetical protein K9J37_23535 [Saprospiraceae bacterium]|nr:hypothetical protein [Saprospiraceae bacterium]MCF8252899.1 hypothetical protein [Saprospiraceae bacterium]MCF8314441.1 hypothetical protein [Saprospiraceae bacterium]